MCGIVGYVGNKKANTILINGLEKLEYRGYDSSGISTIENGQISIVKDKGRVSVLKSLEQLNTLKSSIGIAHTRWATHGVPSKTNAHPHLDNSNSFSVVHNGIIENYNELKEFLSTNGYNFASQTDTEVIPNLVHFYFQKNNDVLLALKNACEDLKGSYAIGLLYKNEPNKLFVAKKDSPLVIGCGEDENFIASDIPAVLSYTNEFMFLEDNEFAVLSKDTVQIFNKNLELLNKTAKEIEWDENSVSKNGYDDFMLKEIYEQPDSIRNTINSRLNENSSFDFEDITISKEELSKFNHIYIIACGTAMHAGLSVKNTFEKLCKIPVTVDVASEFRYRNPLLSSNTLCIFVSQSGETADTIAALKLAKLYNSKTIAITNVRGSSITRESDFSIFTHAGPEIAVASTKAFTAQVTLLLMLAIHFSELLRTFETSELETLKREILSIPIKLENTFNTVNNIKEIASLICNEHDIFFIGRGLDYIVALEGSLKLKEISYIHSDAYAAGELKHGPIALIEDNTTVISIFTDNHLLQKSISNTQEVISRGAKTIVITNQEIDENNFNYVIKIPEVSEFIAPILAIVPLQFLAYFIAKEKNLDVDKPRNLAKSVTVE